MQYASVLLLTFRAPEIYTWHLSLSVCPPRWFDRTLDHNVHGGKVSWGSTSLQKQTHSLLRFLHFYSQHQRRRFNHPHIKAASIRETVILFLLIALYTDSRGLQRGRPLWSGFTGMWCVEFVSKRKVCIYRCIKLCTVQNCTRDGSVWISFIYKESLQKPEHWEKKTSQLTERKGREAEAGFATKT